jgi:pyruvyltransferase
MNALRAFWYRHPNVGDTLTPVILDWLHIPYVRAEARESGKFLGVGSLLATLRDGDVVWGAGCIDETPRPVPAEFTVLAVRGPLSARLLGRRVDVFGDPALLMPLIYPSERDSNSPVIGCVPHYAERAEPEWTVMSGEPNHRVVDVCLPWREFIDGICACRRIVTSSLHAYILAEAYGVPVSWLPAGDKVIGGGFKFRDYFLGTDRDVAGPGPLTRLNERQQRLLAVLNSYRRESGDAAP